MKKVYSSLVLMFLFTVNQIFCEDQFSQSFVNDFSDDQVNFSQNDINSNEKVKKVVSDRVLSDLEFFESKPLGNFFDAEKYENTSKGLLSYIVGPNSNVDFATGFGREAFEEIIRSASSNKEDVIKNQKIIQFFVENSEERLKVRIVLESLKKIENCFNLLRDFESKEELQGLLYVLSLVCSEDSALLKKVKDLQNRETVHLLTTYATVMTVFYSLGISSWKPFIELGTSLYSKYNYPDIFFDLEKFPEFGQKFFVVCCYLGSLLSSVGSSKFLLSLSLDKQKKLIDIVSYMSQSNKLLKELNFQGILPESKKGYEFLDNLSLESSNLTVKEKESLQEVREWLKDAFSKSTFSPGNPSIFSHSGRVENAYKKYSNPQVRKYDEHIFKLIGKVDCYVSLAEKIASHSGKENKPFCFVDFIENKSNPCINITNFWSPFVADDKVVSNSLEFNENDKGVVVTGVNGSGKSLAGKTFLAALILAQSFGIAPASQCSTSLFEKILTHINIKDSSVEGLSLFQAHEAQFKDNLHEVNSLKKDEHAFFLLDEPFNGTNHEKSLKYVNQAAEQLLNKNVIFIIITHLTELVKRGEENASVRNYVAKNYTLSPGVVDVDDY